MKNYSDDGIVHYDAATNERYTEVVIRFEHRGRIRRFALAIPQAMRPSLKSEHYDTAIIVAKKTIDEQLVKCVWAGEFDPDVNARTCDFMAYTAILAHLYNEFHLAQAQAGNQVWAVPELMDDPGPRPENDPIN